MTRTFISELQPRVLSFVSDRADSSSCKSEGNRASIWVLPVAGKDFKDVPVLILQAG